MKYRYGVEQMRKNKNNAYYGDGFNYQRFTNKVAALKYFNQIKKDTNGVIHRPGDKLCTVLNLVDELDEQVNCIKDFEIEFTK